ncbi:MAG: PadR family transcriptional regulator [Candidatus Bathyarchaeota archaeon]|nr:PadR family transcriptional regulator [Candidatus Bathyarchaeota archaeon]
MTKQSDINEMVSDFSRVYILTILHEGPVHGYEIINNFRKVIGKDISPSLVYPFLKKLEQKKLVTHTLKPVGAKKRKIFELTQEGREFSEQLFKRFSELISVALEPSLEVCAHCGCKVYEGGYMERIKDRDLMFCCIHCAGAYKQSLKK